MEQIPHPTDVGLLYFQKATVLNLKIYIFEILRNYFIIFVEK